MKKPATCSECHRPLVRKYGETDYNWRRRLTCSYPCSKDRSVRLIKERRHDNAAWKNKHAILGRRAV